MRGESYMTEESNEGVVRKIFEDFNNRIDWSHYLADDITYVDFSGRTHNKESMSNLFSSLLESFPDCQGRLDRVISKGNTVVIEYTMQGTHEKEFLGIPSTGKKIEYSAAEIYDFEDGKVKSLKNFQRTNDPGWIQYLRE
jgi:steroid delta-isomerase-like uncharacterized protein